MSDWALVALAGVWALLFLGWSVSSDIIHDRTERITACVAAGNAEAACRVWVAR